MLEDFTMEKKSCGRSSQPLLVKGNGTESKKNPDSAGNKIFPRTSRRREPVNSQNTKYETNRKPLPQKSKSFDKRPRPRGQYYGSGKEDTQVAEDQEMEYGSVLIPGSKKQNLNHLLNFHYAPRDGINTSHRNWRANPGGGRSYSSKWLMATHKHKYNKEQFLQANCQFVVKADADYSPCMINPDLLVGWEFIEQIRLRSSEMLSCPICLYPPVAAKMTRCGHVYCWSCILHYLALSDKAWRKCPICYEAVHKQDLRSVIAVPHSSFSVGEEITLRLMKRKRGSLVSLPVNQSEIHSTEKLLSVSETEVDTKYSKLLLASSEAVLSIIDREVHELTSQLAEEQGCPETCFIEQALELLKQRAAVHHGETSQNFLVSDATSESLTSDTGKLSEQSDGSQCFVEEIDCPNKTYYAQNDPVVDADENRSEKCIGCDILHRQRYESVSSEGLESEDGAITVEDIETSGTDMTAFAPGSVTPKDFYFYQAADGQHIYLHAINVRMLEHYYGCLKNCPLTLTGRIVEKETGSMTEELRQRLRYLQHLPVTCQFEVAEIQLKPPIVNRETIEHFQEQLEVRRRHRLRRARDERRREKRITEEENRRWGHFPTPHISINSHRQFPFCGAEGDTAGSSIAASTTSSLGSSPAQTYDEFTPVSSALETVCLDEKISTEESASPGIEHTGSPSGPSFAQMLRDGKSKPVHCWPSVNTERSQDEFKTTGRKHRANYTSDSEPETEGYVSGRALKPSFGDAIAHAMEKAAAAAAAASSSKEDLPDVPGMFGKKKKKQKQKVLFATGMACTSK